jgi:putative transposase
MHCTCLARFARRPLEPSVGGTQFAPRTRSMSHPQRLRGCEYRGRCRVFITTVTPNKRRTFCAEDVCECVSAQLLQRAEECDVEVTAYCMMPDHVHALLMGRSDLSDICRSVARWKQFTGYWYGRRGEGRLWEPGYWDRVLRGDDDPAYFVHYIVMNPLERGLTRHAEQYQWLGSAVFTREELVQIATDFELGTNTLLQEKLTT